MFKPIVEDHLQDIHDLAQFCPKAPNDFDLHDDDDIFNVSPCEYQNLLVSKCL
jgi:hypothetical protein